MAVIENIMSGARAYLRDFPIWFQAAVDLDPLVTTIDLGHQNVMQNGLVVRAVNGSDMATGILARPGLTLTNGQFSYVLDSRNGLLRVMSPLTTTSGSSPVDGWRLGVEGYYTEWVSDIDLKYFTNNIIAEHAYHRSDFDLESISDQEEDLISLGAAVETLWSLLIEYSRDIDISTPEAIGIPASQRFRQVEALLRALLDKYKTKANMLGIGLERIEVLALRRVSRTTNRLVPVYKPREWDDVGRPKRQFPRIDDLGPSSPPDDFTPSSVVTGFYDENGGNVVP